MERREALRNPGLASPDYAGIALLAGSIRATDIGINSPFTIMIRAITRASNPSRRNSLYGERFVKRLPLSCTRRNNPVLLSSRHDDRPTLRFRVKTPQFLGVSAMSAGHGDAAGTHIVSVASPRACVWGVAGYPDCGQSELIARRGCLLATARFILRPKCRPRSCKARTRLRASCTTP